MVAFVAYAFVLIAQQMVMGATGIAWFYTHFCSTARESLCPATCMPIAVVGAFFM